VHRASDGHCDGGIWNPARGREARRANVLKIYGRGGSSNVLRPMSADTLPGDGDFLTRPARIGR
jgi:hypothetical protein